MTEADVTAAYHLAARKGESESVIVERYITGNEHRLLVVGEHVVAAAKGEALWVVGNGKSNVIELVDDQINTDPRRGTNEDSPLMAIAPQHGAEHILELERQGLTAYSIPLDGQKVLIQPNGNVAFDVTDEVHPEVARAAALAARIVGLDIAGIDLVADDISRPLEEQRGAIIEVNASPGLLAHLKPASGKPRPVGAAIIAHLFAPEESGRIPIVGVAGSNGTSLISRLIACILSVSGKHTGVACAQGLFLDQKHVVKTDCAKWDAGQRLLLNRSVQAAVFETNARMILTDGLAYDKCTVGVVTDMDGHADLAEFYVTEAEQMFKILRTQIDVVLPHGAAVLNAANQQVLELADLCDGKVIFYALDGGIESMANHRRKGERVVFLRDENIVLANAENETVLLALSALKSTTTDQAESVIAAVAAAWALDIPAELIGAGLRTFDATSKRQVTDFY
jgi:cyanophycin synthetase